jgi:hypothetical protein
MTPLDFGRYALGPVTQWQAIYKGRPPGCLSCPVVARSSISSLHQTGDSSKSQRGHVGNSKKLWCHVMKSIFQISKSLGFFQPHCAASFNPSHPPFQTLPKHLAAQSSPGSFRPRNAGNKWTRRPSWGTNDGEN